MNEVLVTPYRYAKERGFSPQHVYNWCLRRGCPHSVLDGKVMVNPAVVDTWCAEKEEAKKNKVTKAVMIVARQIHQQERMERQFTHQKIVECKNCGRTCVHTGEVMWASDGEICGQYYTTVCSDCHVVNYHDLVEQKELAFDLMRGRAVMEFP